MNETTSAQEKRHAQKASDKGSPIRHAVALIDRGLLEVEEVVLSYGTISLAVLVIGSVLSRTVLNRSWIFMEEVASTIMIFITFLGLGYCVRKARHIRMSAIHDMLPQSARKVLIIIVSLFTGMVMLVMGYWALLYTSQVYTAGNVTPALRVPFYFIIMWIPIGFFMAAVEYFMAIYKNLRSREVYLSIEIPDGYEDERPTTLTGISEGENGCSRC